MAAERLPTEALRMLAVDAIEVSQWAIRMGMKREQQVDEIVRTFEVTLGYREVKTPPEETATNSTNPKAKQS